MNRTAQLRVEPLEPNMKNHPAFRLLFATALACLCALSWGTMSAHAQPRAQAFLKERHDLVRSILKAPAKNPLDLQARNARLTAVLHDLLDYEELSKRALQDQWGTISPAQRSEFVGLLSRLVERNYQKSLESTLDFKIRYAGEVPGQNGVVVQTLARSKTNGRAPEVAVDYTLVERSGSWKVFDVTTDGVSLVDNYRSQFNRIIHKDGFDALLGRLKKRLSSDNDLL